MKSIITMFTNVLDECTASIFRVESQLERENVEISMSSLHKEHQKTVLCITVCVLFVVAVYTQTLR
jgi:hypothetical protein